MIAFGHVEQHHPQRRSPSKPIGERKSRAIQTQISLLVFIRLLGIKKLVEDQDARRPVYVTTDRRERRPVCASRNATQFIVQRRLIARNDIGRDRQGEAFLIEHEHPAHPESHQKVLDFSEVIDEEFGWMLQCFGK